jgi:hypothetical protein
VGKREAGAKRLFTGLRKRMGARRLRKAQVKCGECPNQAFIEVEDRVIADHLGGKFTAGVYPLMRDDTCWFVALDFDEASWRDDVAAFVETCQAHTLSPAVERSRSGNGAHVWFFFDAPVPARDARDMASYLLTETIRLRRELKLESYDRLFPSQDTLPQGGFGNLIALPFQFQPRKAGHGLFVDSRFEAFPWEQQWQFLADIERLGRDRVRALAREAVRTARVLAVPQPDGDDEEDDTPWKPKASAAATTKLPFLIPSKIKAVLAQRLFIEKVDLPPPLLSRLRRLAAFQNPEFYKRQKLRLSTARTPRIVVCAEDLPKHLALPRACIDDTRSLLEGNGSRLICNDQRNRGKALTLTFLGTLTDTTSRATANPFAERVIGTFRRDCFDHIIVRDEHHARRVLREYSTYYHGRPHRGLRMQPPDGARHLPPRRPPAGTRIIGIPIFGGLHHRYGFAVAARAPPPEEKRSA